MLWSDQARKILFKEYANTRMTTARQYDFLNRLQSIRSAPSAAGELPVAFTYLYNDANQRIQTTLADGGCWVYQYDRLGQVTSGKRYWSDGSPVPGQQFEYGFDDIGNRTTAKWGGDTLGAGLRSANYTATLTNTYSSRTVPGGFDVLGIANAAASVTVNSSAADYRRGEYFQEAVSVNNESGSVWQAVNVTAVNGGSSSNWPAGSVFVPPASEGYTYDADGNMTGDGRWTYTWDGENRLIRMVAKVAAGPHQRLDFAYDAQGRRISKRVWPNTGGTGTLTSDLLFVYDGWNLVAELNATNKNVIRGYFWGLDLSGSEQGAGGVGGLLAIRPAGGAAHFAAFDGNGNVAALVDGSTGVASASYEYGPFAESIRANGVAAKVNPFRFSTKYTDDETDLLYYGHRYYSPSTGRWLNRDPQTADSATDPYTFVANTPTDVYDFLGLWGTLVHRDSTTSWAIELGIPDLGATAIGIWDDRVDKDFDTYVFSEANWSWHFDRGTGAEDSRLLHTVEELRRAKWLCTWFLAGNDAWATAAAHMGRALHPLQDWVAHGDFNRRAEAPNISSVRHSWDKIQYAHNKLTPFANQGWETVDNPLYDAEGLNGRPSFPVLQKAKTTEFGDDLYYTRFSGGNRRIELTKTLTTALLSEFREHVRLMGKPCGECQRRFLGSE